MTTLIKGRKPNRPKIKYPCGCLIHVNGPDEGMLNICRHCCKSHAKKIAEMRELVQKHNKAIYFQELL